MPDTGNSVASDNYPRSFSSRGEGLTREPPRGAMKRKQWERAERPKGAERAGPDLGPGMMGGMRTQVSISITPPSYSHLENDGFVSVSEE